MNEPKITRCLFCKTAYFEPRPINYACPYCHRRFKIVEVKTNE